MDFLDDLAQEHRNFNQSFLTIISFSGISSISSIVLDHCVAIGDETAWLGRKCLFSSSIKRRSFPENVQKYPQSIAMFHLCE